MTPPIRALQTTIESLENDWHIGRFALLRDFLTAQKGDDGDPLFAVTARDRASPDRPDPVLSTSCRPRCLAPQPWPLGVPETAPRSHQ
jgi:hypothetical protein